MLNYIWFGLMAIALVVAAFNGTADAGDQRRRRVRLDRGEISLGLVGIMTLWLGIMRVAEAAGWSRCSAGAAARCCAARFPEVPPDHPAAGAIVLRIAANMLGLNNAATPLGIKAMEELQTLNPTRTRPPIRWSRSWP